MAKIFDFISEERLFHFLTDAANASGIEITPHLTDEKPPVGGGTGVASSSGEVSSDPFLKNLFSDNKEKKAGDSLILQSLIKSEEESVEKKKSILGELPKIDTSLFIDQEFQLKKRLSYAKIGFASLISFGFALYVFFYTQLNPTFELFGPPNIGKTLMTVNDQLKSFQTDVNLARYSTAKKLLDQFFYNANEYLMKYEAWKSAPESKKAELLTALDATRADVIGPFDSAREKLSKDKFVALYREMDLVPNRADLTEDVAKQEEIKLATEEFEGFLKQHIQEKKNAALERIKGVNTGTGTNFASQNSADASELRELNELLQIVGNKPLQTLIASNLDKMTHEQLRKFILQISGKYHHRLAFIFQIKDSRIPWFDIINEIYDRTGAIDKGRFKAKLYDDIGGIRYTGFDFAGESGRITISGSVKDFNGVNFTIMAGLIDELESSRQFKDVEMRSFSKNFSEKDGFEGTFKIDLSIQKYDDIDMRDKGIDINKLPDLFKKAEKEGAKEAVKNDDTKDDSTKDAAKDAPKDSAKEPAQQPDKNDEKKSPDVEIKNDDVGSTSPSTT